MLYLYRILKPIGQPFKLNISEIIISLILVQINSLINAAVVHSATFVISKFEIGDTTHCNFLSICPNAIQIVFSLAQFSNSIKFEVLGRHLASLEITQRGSLTNYLEPTSLAIMMISAVGGWYSTLLGKFASAALDLVWSLPATSQVLNSLRLATLAL